MIEPTRDGVKTALNKPEITNKLINAIKAYLRKQEAMLNQGLIFEKKVTKFSKTSAAIYLPKRLIGKTFRIELTPLDDPYEISEPEKTDLKAEKELKAAEKDLKKIQNDRINLLKPNEL